MNWRKSGMNNRDDEIIREALKLDITVPDELNRRILRAAERKKHNGMIWRTAVTVAVCFLIFLGMGAIVKATSGRPVSELIKEKINSWTYVYENGSETKREIVREDGEIWEEVTFIKEKVVMTHHISEDVTDYWLCLKVTDSKGYNHFMSLDAWIEDAAPLRDLYYMIRGYWRSQLEHFTGKHERLQVLAALRDAAAKAKTASVRNGLLDLASDYDNNRRIYFKMWPGKHWGVDGMVLYFEEVTDIPPGEVYLIVEPVNDKQLTFIDKVCIDEDKATVAFESGYVYSEEAYREAVESGLPVYDLRKNK